ncbi:ParB N-terminal domain-containing protein [Faecalicatena orotica]|nr:ParB N-terminal domain-containing protein [Faecalicatena orotica]
MKANAPKRKVFQDALDLLAEDPVKDTPVLVNGIVSIPVEEIHPFHDHPFRLYEGDRLEDMVQSIREHGVLNPVIVRKAARGYEMLAGHNRTNAAKIAGLTEVPAIVKTDLSDEDAYVYVIETNLLQRSFAELLPSEKAAVLVARYEKISSQGKRNDIRQEIEALEETCGHDVHKSRQRTCGHDVHKLQKSRNGLGEKYGMTGRNIARYMRLDRLIPEFKDAMDKGTLAMVAAVNLSYLNVKMQKLIQQVAEAEGKKLKPNQAVELRKMGKEITKEGIESVLAGKERKKPQSVSVKLSVELYEKYFAQMDAGAVQKIMEKALEGYFGKEAAGV